MSSPPDPLSDVEPLRSTHSKAFVTRQRFLGVDCIPLLFGCMGQPVERPIVGDPGTVTIRRLNRTEYDFTVRDLLGTNQRPARDFSADDHAYGFDNIADALSLPPLQAELYASAADKLVSELVGRRPYLVFQAEDLRPATGHRFRESAWRFWEGSISVQVPVTAPGRYRITAQLSSEHGPVDARLAFGTHQLDFSVSSPAFEPHSIQATFDAKGEHTLSLSIRNPPQTTAFLPALRLDWLRVEGPLVAALPSSVALFDCTSGIPCAEKIVREFASRAFRRPLDSGELERLMNLVKPALDDGAPFDEAVANAFEATLVSPHFLFRIEPNSSPKARWLTDHELATRLSYFLWASMPDEPLRRLANEGRLQDDQVLVTQIHRMLADPKSERLVEDFAGQWLQLRALDQHAVDAEAFPLFNDELRHSMRLETHRFFAAFVAGEMSYRELLTADFAFLDARLAAHVGLPKLTGDGLSRVQFPSDFPRRGILGQSSFLTVSSYPTRTSPVQRGKWVLSQLLCSAPPPPPPGVDGLPEPNQVPGSVRKRLEAHVNKPACAGCHRTMDPIGFGLEHFDGTGHYRTEDLGFPIDASGVLPDGRRFNGATELSLVLAEDPYLSRCLTDTFFTYASGRAPAQEDNERLGAVDRTFVKKGGTLPALIEALVLSSGFRARRPEAAP